MIDMYRFNIELLAQISTNMTGSCEGKTCYIYRQKEETQQSKGAGSKTKSMLFLEPNISARHGI
jgi:hypothetical protein